MVAMTQRANQEYERYEREQQAFKTSAASLVREIKRLMFMVRCVIQVVVIVGFLVVYTDDKTIRCWL